MHPTPRHSVIISLAALVASAGLLNAGPLNPPAGPVASTMKTLSEVEPRIAINATNTPGDANSLYRITQPGSYFLAGNVTGLPNKSGIEIAASGVTIDLSGFTMTGSGLGDGIVVDALRKDITVKNGTIKGWYHGIDLHAGFPGSDGSRIESVTVSENSHGIMVGSGAVITGCVSRANSVYGIELNGPGVVTQCTVNANGGDGIYAGVGATISNCTANGNGGRGIGCAWGVVSGCAVMYNNYVGINAYGGCIVENCTVLENATHGILMTTGAVARHNRCGDNGRAGDGAGIRVEGADCLVEGNNCTGNDWGIQVTTAGSFFSRNSCSGNTLLNWSVVAGNACYVVSATAGTAINGNNGGLSVGSTDPNANFTY